MITVKKGKNYDQLNNEFIIRFGFAYLNNIVEQRFKKKDKVVIIIGTDGVKEHKKLLEILNKMLIMFKRVNVIYHYNVSLPFAKFFQRKMKAEALIYIGHNNSDFKYSNLIIYNENNQLISRIIADKLEFNTNKTVNNPDKKIIKQILKTRIVRSFEIPYKQICDYFKEFNFEKIKVKKMPAVHRRVGLVAFGGTGRWLNILKSRLLANGIELVNINYASYQNILLNGAFNIAMVRDLTFNPTFTSQYARL
jgi:phosphomannomutase